ncbi:MAG TPA: NADH-quinone oxidoreductase subunit L [Actinocrinis sp.]|uniref:NADH-quinone oxidoreductase subunit 5 family protein n=1 Tax=Actinocrinis sp. TaxID=1920516 RepID=UPI002DDD2948|nr:NADH-quinone oxidoreductase subunit L [Actinocrinis sp.]HEV2345660.1 NADH-quinone oxidoreductase subunit L [Actinocrinis sp.]
MNVFAALTVALPFLGSAVTFAGARDLRHVKFWSVAPIAAALFTSLVVQVAHGAGGTSTSAMQFAPAGQSTVWLGTRVTGLSALTGILVTVVALCVQVYSLTYMRQEKRYPTYAALVSLFTAAMLLVVYSADLIVLLVGWEVMGACSYFLIGHHWERADARSGSIKAFLVTKTGDVPFLFGIAALGVRTGSFRIDDVLHSIAVHGLAYAPFIATLLLCGVVGKSAQFPLHTWLPDAMAGPTPISALIHAATMVAAGVYVVALLYPVFLLAPGVLTLMAVIAAITMIGSALAAFAQTDVKKVLAYSTVSQLAYMLGGLAAGGRAAAVFHLLTHGAFKALLFLAAGVVIHRVGSNDLSAMGGLRHRMPIAYRTMTIALAALVGVPLFSGWFSKEAILGAAWDAHGQFAAAGRIVLIAGLLTVGLTAAYATRLWLKMFWGPFPDASPEEHLIEAPQTELVPLIVLAVPSAILGFVALGGGAFASWIGDAFGLAVPAGAGADLAPGGPTSALAFVLTLLGAGGVWYAWQRDPAADPARLLGPWRETALYGFYLDDVQDLIIIQPAKVMARVVGYLDTEVVDAYARGAGISARGLGGLLRRVQTGNIQLYLTVLFTGVIIIAAAMIILVGHGAGQVR